MNSFKLLFFIILLSSSCTVLSQDKLVIAHRGASGYLPEHTMESKVLAVAQGAHYIEQDVVMTQDNQLIVFHDLTLDRMTNVEELFPQKARPDGHFYVIDFTLNEIKQLSVSEGFTKSNNTNQAIFAQRFPIWQSSFGIHTLREELELLQGMKQSMGVMLGIYIEIKSPWFHRQTGKDISLAILEELKSFGFDSVSSQIYLQTFDFNELVRVHDELLPSLGMDLKLVQLIAESQWNETYEINSDGELSPYQYEWMLSGEGLQIISNYAVGVGPNFPMLVSPESVTNNVISNGFVENAHVAGLKVHPYTFRQDAGLLPEYATDFNDMLDIFYNQLDVDGVFTDYPDLAIQFLENMQD